MQVFSYTESDPYRPPFMLLCWQKIICPQYHRRKSTQIKPSCFRLWQSCDWSCSIFKAVQQYLCTTFFFLYLWVHKVYLYSFAYRLDVSCFFPLLFWNAFLCCMLLLNSSLIRRILKLILHWDHVHLLWLVYMALCIICCMQVYIAEILQKYILESCDLMCYIILSSWGPKIPYHLLPFDLLKHNLVRREWSSHPTSFWSRAGIQTFS